MPSEMQQLTDQYQLLRRIGRGGMGEVWAGSRSGPNGMWMTCAIKLLHRELAETARDVDMFLNEARIASQLDHSRIVKVIDVGTANDTPFIVMEWVDGVNLRSFTNESQKHGFWPLDIDITTYIVGEVLAALEYAHDRTIGGMDAGVIHYDVTPGNIMISSSGEVKLTDFGIARFAATAGPLSRSVGTPRYMSPEQMTGHPRRETDIYSLGVVLHELLDGRRYLENYTADQFQAQVLLGSAPDLARTDVPAWLDDLRRRMLSNRPELRPSARGVRTVLVDNCPRYMAAAEQIKNRAYPRLIGRKRSGMTELFNVGAIQTAIRKQMLGATPTPSMVAGASTGNSPKDPEQAVATELELPKPIAANERVFSDHDSSDVPAFTRHSGSRTPANAAAQTRADEPGSLGSVGEASALHNPQTLTSDRRDQLRIPASSSGDAIEVTEELTPIDVQRALQLQASTSSRSQEIEAPIEVTHQLAPVFFDATGGSSSVEPSQWSKSNSVVLVESVAPPSPPTPQVARPSWSMVAALVAIGLLSVLSVSLLIKISQGSERGDEIASPVTVGPSAVPASVGDSDKATSATVTVIEPSVIVVPPQPSERVADADAEGESNDAELPPEPEPAPVVEAKVEPTKPATKRPPTQPAKPAPKVGVSFLFDVETGEVEIAGVSRPIKNGAAYVAVSSGKKHAMRFKPEGADAWQTIGKLDAQAIAPAGYVVSFQKGTLSIQVRQGGTK